MKRLLPFLSLFAVAALAPAQTVSTLVNHGAPANRIDLVFVSEGYTAGEMTKFTADVNQFLAGFFASEVYKEYANYFNVQTVAVPSNQSGASHPELSPPVLKDTAFGAAYNCASIARLICVNTSKVAAVVNPLLPANQRDYVIVLVNDSTYGGSGGSVLVSSTNTLAIEIVLHESGHTLGLLADEYTDQPPACDLSVEPSEANATRVSDRATVKWSAWIDVATSVPTTTTTPGVPGLYLGSDYCPTGMYRPTFNSKMRQLGNHFEQVNDEQLVRRFYNTVSPIDTFTPKSSTVSVQQGAQTPFSVTSMAPATHSLSIAWTLDGVAQVAGSSLMVDTSKLSFGFHTVSVQVKDVSTWVRSDPAGLLTDSQTWQLNVTNGPPGPDLQLAIGNNTPATLYFIQGQSFTPSVLGNRGSGTAPATGAVGLTTFTFDFEDPSTAPTSLYIYASLPTVAQVNANGQGSMARAVGRSGVYSFANLPLDVNTKYFAVLSDAANIFDGSGNTYTGGGDLFVTSSAATSLIEGGFDAGFTATFGIANQMLPATTTALSANPVFPAVGQAVTLTATVLPAAATGAVTFMDGGAPLGTASLSGGVASITTSALVVGSHALTAVYGGSATYSGSVSPPSTVTVRAGGVATWSVTQSHIGNFSAAQPLAYFTVTVGNPQGSSATSGAVTVTEIPPGNVSAVVLSGANWNCAGNTCTRSDVLAPGASYPPITVSMTLASDGSSALTNQVSVAGGGLGQMAASDTATVLPPFVDITNDDLFLPAIDLLRESGITTGCQAAPPKYCENDNITQAQMAVFVVRSVMGSDNFTFTSTPYFTDVPADNLYFQWIQKMRDLGIALPCSATQFCPDQAVTRAQMAVLIIRGRYGVPSPPNFPTAASFTDVDPAYPYFAWIQKMKQVGITTGCSPTTYCPDTPVTRGQMAVFIMRGMFNVLLPAGTPLLNISPSHGSPGQSVTVTIQAQAANFASSVTQVSAGPGITVSNVVVASGTSLTATFAIDANAAVGPRSILVTTGGQEATLPNGFLVVSGQ